MVALVPPARLSVAILSSAFLAVPPIAAAVPSPAAPACQGPQQMVTALAAHPNTDNAILLGSWYASRKSFGCAVDTFRAALKRDPSSAQLHFLDGLALVGGGHEPEAIVELQNAIGLDPGSIKPHEVLAQLFDRAGKAGEAAEQWRLVLASDPGAAEALEALSSDLLVLKNYPGVVKLLEAAPRTEALALNLGSAYESLNDAEQASKAFSGGLKLAPKSLPLARELAALYARHLRFEDAIKVLNQAYADHPNDTDIELQLYSTLLRADHVAEARPLGPKLLAKRPHDPEVLYLNGVVEQGDKDYLHARAHLEEAIRLKPNDPETHYNLGMVLVTLSEWQPAVVELQKAVALGDPFPQVHFQLARAMRGLGDNEGAKREIDLYQKIRRSAETTVEAVDAARQGDQALEAGDLKEALTEYKVAVDREPANAGYRYKLSVALHRSGDLAGEQAQLEEAIKLDPGHAAAQRQLGYLMDRGGDPDAAVAHFRSAVQAAPSWVEAWVNLSAELAATGQMQEARTAVATALRLDPANASALKLSGMLSQDPRAR